MSVFAYFWDSETHLSNLAFAIELAGCLIEVVVAVVAVSTLPKEWTKKRKDRIRHQFELFGVIAALVFLVAVVSNKRIAILEWRIKLEESQTTSNRLDLATARVTEAESVASNAFGRMVKSEAVASNALLEAKILKSNQRAVTEAAATLPKNRLITMDGAERIKQKLMKAPKIRVQVTFLDEPHPKRLGGQIDSLFKESNFSSESVLHIGYLPVRGVKVESKKEPDVAMRNALNQIFSEIEQTPVILVETNIDFDIQIMVGASD